MLPTDELGDEDWQFGEMSLSDFSGDYNSDLRLTLFHEDMSESYIVWEWEKGRRLSLPAVRLLISARPRGRGAAGG